MNDLEEMEDDLDEIYLDDIKKPLLVVDTYTFIVENYGFRDEFWYLLNREDKND